MLFLLAAMACRSPGDEPGQDDDIVDSDLYEEVAIASIQQGVIPLDTPVRVIDVVVTGVAPSGRGLFVQESADLYGGVWVYTRGGGFVYETNQIVTVTGRVQEYDAEGEWADSLTEIDSSTEGEVIYDGGTDVGFDPILLDDPSVDLEPYEGMLVTVSGLTVDERLPYGEWTANGWTFDDKLFEGGLYYPDDTFDSITGVLDYGYGSYKIQPRSAEDLVGYSSEVIRIEDLEPGELVLSELMIDPGDQCVDADDEYVELYNASGSWLDLDGLVVSYDDQSVSMDYTVVAPDSHVLLVRQSPSPCYDHAGDAELHLPLTQESGVVSLSSESGTVLDSVDGSDWVVEPGVAMGWDGQAWCPQSTPLRSDFGTPGAENDLCD